MRLILEFVSGPSPLPKIWLVPGQSATVGRTADADYAADSDRFMSSLHFRIECRDTSCWIRDLGSTNGTFLNNEQVVESALRSGDHLRAGQTVFSIHVEGAEHLTTGSVPLSRSVVLELASAVAPVDAPVLPATPAVPPPSVPSPAAAELAAVAAPLRPPPSPLESVAASAAPGDLAPAPRGDWPVTQTVP
ncbi:MAG: FHA domain-containing protein, partial [Pirellulaceae bacterium]